MERHGSHIHAVSPPDLFRSSLEDSVSPSDASPLQTSSDVVLQGHLEPARPMQMPILMKKDRELAGRSASSPDREPPELHRYIQRWTGRRCSDSREPAPMLRQLSAGVGLFE